MKKIRICTAYELDGKKIQDFPLDINVLERCKPVYEELDGWMQDTSSIRSYDKLPEKTRKYLKRLRDLVGVEIDCVSVGRDRNKTIILKELF